MTSLPGPDAIEAQITALTQARGPDKSICPSEVARALLPEWQGLMRPVRAVATKMALAGQIEILRHGKPVDPTSFKGVIRLRARPGHT